VYAANHIADSQVLRRAYVIPRVQTPIDNNIHRRTLPLIGWYNVMVGGPMKNATKRADVRADLVGGLAVRGRTRTRGPANAANVGHDDEVGGDSEHNSINLS